MVVVVVFMKSEEFLCILRFLNLKFDYLSLSVILLNACYEGEDN